MGYTGVTMPIRKLANVMFVTLVALAMPALAACGGAGGTGSPPGEDRSLTQQCVMNNDRVWAACQGWMHKSVQ